MQSYAVISRADHSPTAPEGHVYQEYCAMSFSNVFSNHDDTNHEKPIEN